MPVASEMTAPPRTQDYAKRSTKKGKWVPLYAAAAMVLFIMVLAPVGFIMFQTRNERNPPLVSSTPANSNSNSANSNKTANINSDFESEPDVRFVGLDGGKLRLTDFRGRVVLLNFWATSSIASRIEIPLLNDLQKTLEPRGLTVIGLTRDDTVDQIRQFQKGVPQNYQIGLGGRGVDDQLPASALPTTYIIDRRGRVRHKLIGNQSRAAFEAAIEPLLDERP